MTAGQLSIFDVIEPEAKDVICPVCGYSWNFPGLLNTHLEGSNGWPWKASETGKCANQQRCLYSVAAQSHFGLRLRESEPNVAYKYDILGVILEAKARGCTDRQIQTVLTAARPKAGGR